MLLKKSVLALTMGALLGLGVNTPALAQKIAFVDATKVVENSPQYEGVRKSLEAEFTKRDQDLVERQKALRKQEEKLSRDGDVMGPEEQRKLETDIRNERRDLARAQDIFREDFNLRRNEEFNKLRRVVQEVVRDIGKEEGIDLILSDGVVYFSKEVDISDKVLQRLMSKGTK
jgi:outer membrane protein